MPLSMGSLQIVAACRKVTALNDRLRGAALTRSGRSAWQQRRPREGGDPVKYEVGPLWTDPGLRRDDAKG